MAKVKKNNFRKEISSKDFNRIILSETPAFDVPLIFSNIWFYNHLTDENSGDTNKAIFVEKIFKSKKLHQYSVPMKFRIRKNDREFRYIGIMHPAEQFKYVNFYKEFTKTIIHYTSLSPFSIRYPSNVASKFNIKTSYPNLKDNRNSQNESKFKHSASYFSYGGHKKLHEFYDSSDYRILETKYSHLWSFDISKCFDSIYTHSISWAIKEKKHAKESTSHKDTFGAIFDKLMQSSNYNETNGILVGNEISRIFAEVILQKIDLELESSLKEEGLINKRDYEIRRYIDDYFVFGKTEYINERIFENLINKLHRYKLHLNSSKTSKQGRPFLTEMSNSKLTISELLNELSATLFSKPSPKELTINTRTRIKNSEKLITSWINKVKAACGKSSKTYEHAAGYIVGYLLRNATELSDSNIKINEDEHFKAREIIILLIQIGFHFFGISPNTSNSSKLSMLSFILVNFSEKTIPDDVKSIKLEISKSIKTFFESGSYIELVESNNYFPIELANLLISACNMGDNFLLPPKEVKKVFDIDSMLKSSNKYDDKETCSDYFRIICALYYIGDHSIYGQIKSDIVKCISKRNKLISDINLHSKYLYLLLDCISCPTIKREDRLSWSRTLKTLLSNHKEIKSIPENDFFKVISSNNWFVSWNKEDLWSTIEKNQLILSY